MSSGSAVGAAASRDGCKSAVEQCRPAEAQGPPALRLRLTPRARAGWLAESKPSSSTPPLPLCSLLLLPRLQLVVVVVLLPPLVCPSPAVLSLFFLLLMPAAAVAKAALRATVGKPAEAPVAEAAADASTTTAGTTVPWGKGLGRWQRRELGAAGAQIRKNPRDLQSYVNSSAAFILPQTSCSSTKGCNITLQHLLGTKYIGV